MTSIICSLDMPWDQLSLYIYNLSCQVIPVRTKGFCFLHAIDMVLCMAHDEVVRFDNMESTILGHLGANINYYKLFHTGDVLKDAEMYFKSGMYCDNVLDPIVVATARALKLNLTIYQKGPKVHIQILKHTTHATGKEVHLKFPCDPSNVANNHYEAPLLLNKPTEEYRKCGDHRESISQYLWAANKPRWCTWCDWPDR